MQRARIMMPILGADWLCSNKVDTWSSHVLSSCCVRSIDTPCFTIRGTVHIPSNDLHALSSTPFPSIQQIQE